MLRPSGIYETSRTPAWYDASRSSGWYDSCMRRLLIDPRTSHFLLPWDTVMSSALIFTTFVTPFEVALLGESVKLQLYIVNRVVDGIFVTDLVLQFFLVYPVAKETGL